MARSDPHDVHAFGVGGQCLKVLRVGGQHRSTRFGESHHEGVNRRAATGMSPQQRRSSCEGFGDRFGDVARLEEPVLDRVPAGMSFQALDEDNRRDQGWPQTFAAKRDDERCRLPRAFGKTADPTRIEYQHGSQPTLRRVLPTIC